MTSTKANKQQTAQVILSVPGLYLRGQLKSELIAKIVNIFTDCVLAQQIENEAAAKIASNLTK